MSRIPSPECYNCEWYRGHYCALLVLFRYPCEVYRRAIRRDTRVFSSKH